MSEPLNPLFRSTARGVYKTGAETRKKMPEAPEQVRRITVIS
jgi:hypothetical protein